MEFKKTKWKGKHLCYAQGYFLVRAPDHPYASGGYVLLHRIIMENHLGRYLKSWEIVHHVDDDRSNNVLSNLELTSRRGHGKIHAKALGKILRKKLWMVCPICKENFFQKWENQVCCDIVCYQAYRLMQKPIRKSGIPKPKIKCLSCKEKFEPRTKTQQFCSNSCARTQVSHPRKVTHPSLKELKKLVWKYPRTTLAKRFGVSDVAISNWCKRLGIEMPGRGYWNTRE